MITLTSFRLERTLVRARSSASICFHSLALMHSNSADLPPIRKETQVEERVGASVATDSDHANAARILSANQYQLQLVIIAYASVFRSHTKNSHNSWAIIWWSSSSIEHSQTYTTSTSKCGCGKKKHNIGISVAHTLLPLSSTSP